MHNRVPLFTSLKKSNVRQTQESFGFKWTTHPQWGFTQATHRFMREWFYKKYGWKNKQNFKKYLLNKHCILDAGCGLGREVFNMAVNAPHAMVYGIDFSNSVLAVPSHVLRMPNVMIMNADLNMTPFQKEYFDFILSEGVIHHTPNPFMTFCTLIRHLKKGGEIAFYIYHKKPPIREYVDSYIRKNTTSMTWKDCWNFSRETTVLGKVLSGFKSHIILKRGFPEIGIAPGKYTVQELFYYYFIKCFWNDKFTFSENCLVNFDWYHPSLAFSYTVEEIKSWCKKMNVSIIHLHTSLSGITVRGIKQ